MSETKFTKGVWVMHSGPFSTHNHPSEYWECAVVSGHKLTAKSAAASAEESEANASLIACAPKLYSKLQETVNAIRIWSTEGPLHGPSQWEAEEMVRTGDTLLAKARGEA